MNIYLYYNTNTSWKHKIH